MGVDSKLFVVCKQEEKMSVVKTVLDVLDILSLERLSDKGSELDIKRFWLLRDDTYGHYSAGAKLRSYDFESFTIDLGVGDENSRIVQVHTECDCDVASYLPDGMGAVIVSLGCWGSSVMIMDTIADALKSFGDVYIDYNDCDDVDYVKVN